MLLKEDSVKATIWVYIQDGCDGSATAKFFNTEAAAEEYADLDFEAVGQRFCEDIGQVTLEFDSDGFLLNPARWTK